MPIGFAAVFMVILVVGNLAMNLLGMPIDATGLTGLDRPWARFSAPRVRH